MLMASSWTILEIFPFLEYKMHKQTQNLIRNFENFILITEIYFLFKKWGKT